MIEIKLRLLPSALPMLQDNGDIDIQGISAIVLRNAGTATVELFHGLYTLDPKETLSVNVTELFAVLDLHNISVTFDTGTGSVKKLQILVLKRLPTSC